MSSLARSGTVDRGRAQRARYLGDDARTGRSRSVSRSRSRSRSPSPAARESRDKPSYWLALGLDAQWAEMLAADAARPSPFAWMHAAQANGEKTAAELGMSCGDARWEPAWSRAPTNGENIAAELVLRRAANDTLWVCDAKAVVDPKTYESLVTLVEATIPTGTLGHLVKVGRLASGLGPETMPAAHLADILLAVRHANTVKAATRIHGDLAHQIFMWHIMGCKVTFGELAKTAKCVEEYGVWAHDALRRLAVEVGNKHGDVDVDTKIDVNVLGAETGPETMSLLTLVILLTGVPGFAISCPTLSDLLLGKNPMWRITLGGLCYGLARK